MGALCGKESHFQGEGHTLNGPSTTSGAVAPQKSYNTLAPPQTVGGGSKGVKTATSASSGRSATTTDDRAARAAAAEARMKEQKKKGVQATGGALAAKTDAQAKDGGRKEEAIKVGTSGRDQELRWD